jgi:RNA polymerase sigma-70 factor (ECF subfamily)
MHPIEAARKGREAAFLALFDEHHAALFRYAYRFTGSVADAEDIVQECFLEILRPGSRYDEARTPIRTYLFGVVRNQSLKRLQKRDRVVTSFPEQNSPESAFLRNELSGIVANAVTHLPETQREVLILAHYEQLPLAEIAQVLALDIGAVKSRLQRARAALKETLAVLHPHPEQKK